MERPRQAVTVLLVATILPMPLLLAVSDYIIRPEQRWRLVTAHFIQTNQVDILRAAHIIYNNIYSTPPRPSLSPE